MLFGGSAFALGAPQHNALCSAPCECFFGALTDEVTFDFGRKPKGEGQHLALDVVAKPVVVFDGPDSTFATHTDVEDLHNHKQVAPQPREFGADDDVVFAHFAKQAAELTLVVGLGATDGLFDPVVDGEFATLAEVGDFESLVLDSLFVATDSDVSVYHNVWG